jgi:hypothetical protein
MEYDDDEVIVTYVLNSILSNRLGEVIFPILRNSFYGTVAIQTATALLASTEQQIIGE